MRLLSLGLLVLGALPLRAEESSPSAPPPPDLGYTEALILGLVEGITEYLPISSTGHLILTNALLGLDSEEPLLDDLGRPVRVEDEPLTLKRAADAYAIVIQAGAIAAVLLLYRGRVWSVLLGFLGRSAAGLRLGRNLILAFIPAAVIGLLLGDLIDAYLFGPWPVVGALVAGAILMAAVELSRKRRGITGSDTDLSDLSPAQALVIGAMQCLALFPGTSRSMVTIVGGYFCGLSPARAAEFSFLLGLVTLTAAAGYTGLKEREVLAATLDPGPALFGIAVATLSAALAVKWLVGFLQQHGLMPFAVYRVVLALAVAGWMLTNL